MRTRTIRYLHGLRGVAALAIVFFHLGTLLAAIGPTQFPVPTGLWKNAYLFVDLFFILSGFIMGHVYRDRFYGPRRAPFRRALGDFYRARIARLAPLYYATLFGALLIAIGLYYGGVRESVFTPWESKGAFLGAALLVQAWGVLDLFGWNFPSWSISAETGAYLIFPVLLWASEKWRGAALALICTGLLGYGVMEAVFGHLDITHQFGVGRAIFGFSAGLGLWQWMRRRGCVGAASRLTTMGWGAAVVILAVMQFGGPQTVAVAAMLVLVGILHADKGALANGLSHPFCDALGTYSYSMYLTHGLVWTVMFESMRGRGDTVLAAAPLASTVSIGLVFLLVTAGLSLAAYHLIEKPGRKVLRPRSSSPSRSSGRASGRLSSPVLRQSEPR